MRAGATPFPACGTSAAPLLLAYRPLGAYMARVYRGDARSAEKLGGWLERLVYRFARVDPHAEMTWKAYALAALFFNLAGEPIVNRVVEGYSTFRRCGIDVLVAGAERVAKRVWTEAETPEEIEA